MSDHAGKSGQGSRRGQGGKRHARNARSVDSGQRGVGVSPTTRNSATRNSATRNASRGAIEHDTEHDISQAANDGERRPSQPKKQSQQGQQSQAGKQNRQGKPTGKQAGKPTIVISRSADATPITVTPRASRRQPRTLPHLIPSVAPVAVGAAESAESAESIARAPQDDTPAQPMPPAISAATGATAASREGEGEDEDDAGSRIIQLELNDLAYGGDAVGRYEGRAIFVAGGLPGELVRARLIRERSSYARAALVEVLRASPERVAPRYPELADSGGFQWQHLAYPAQVAWKSRIVRQLLMRVGHFANPPVAPTLGMPADADPWRYRTVAQFAIGAAGEIGFRRTESHAVIDMPTCPIVHPTLDALYQGVRDWLRSAWGADAADYVERFTLRVAGVAPGGREATGAGADEPWRTGEDQDTYRDAEVGLLTLEARPGGAIDAFGGPEAVGEAICHAVAGLAGVVILGMAGGRGRVVVGQDFVHEHVLDRRFRISAGSFFQVNPTQTPTLVRTALAALRPQPGDWALDGYSGVGLFSLFLADHVTHVRAIESQPSAVADARASVTLNGVSNVSITEGVLERTLGELRSQRERADIALVDPPRSGCHPRALAGITALRPRALVYVSCDPSTLARDLRLICDAGYSLTSVQPVDMFPFTAHIECVALCERVDG